MWQHSKVRAKEARVE